MSMSFRLHSVCFRERRGCLLYCNIRKLTIAYIFIFIICNFVILYYIIKFGIKQSKIFNYM